MSDPAELALIELGDALAAAVEAAEKDWHSVSDFTTYVRNTDCDAMLAAARAWRAGRAAREMPRHA